MPKVLIDIPEYMFEDIKDRHRHPNKGNGINLLECSVANGTELPENFSLEDYERYKKDSENLSWIKCPEKMGN